MVTRKEVAELANVSEATVSRVFNGLGPMKPATKERVLEAANALGYHPNAIAQSFARRRSGNLGVVLPYMPKVHLFSTYYFSEILSGIGEQVREMGYDLLLSLLTPDDELDYGRLYRSQKVDACIILGSMDTPSQRQSLLHLQENGHPFCLVNQRFEGLDFLEVDADHVEGSYQAVRHLIDEGNRQIAFLNGSPQYSNSRDRWLGYQRAMLEAGLPINSELLLEGNYSRKSGYEAAAKLWEMRGRVDAVFAANDRMAIGVMQGLRERGWMAGREFAVIGCDDSDAAKLSDPPLSSIAVPFFEMGKGASRLVLASVGQGVSEEGQVQLSTQLRIRQSSIKRQY
ncbi:LacI family DNA-binding transcriptional regulator [Paenibacillus roseipurpureus]|uniref:LacI family DNA-binding transcriptional regulator n=1 Tax=Paenibacillus roseopurpureus TaxID=2918901 RepID=A0AA96RNI7_9BACL|nr:LacI family DNA-binding transcriptional regulator [Paenibacillus sp. MBLB1832]WNR45532.1 LacI family DNA-binding transcriptional regulator [Paenibacillus sp. MBLB1832]